MEAEQKYFDIIAANDIRSFVGELNRKGLTKEDIISTFYNVSRDSYYAIVYR